MFLDLDPDRFRDDHIPCKGCKRPILADDATEQVQMPHDADSTLLAYNGIYHALCARPILSLTRAMMAMSRLSFLT